MTFPDPSPGRGEVVLEMKASGMCGSGLYQYRQPKGQPCSGTGVPPILTRRSRGTSRVAWPWCDEARRLHCEYRHRADLADRIIAELG